MCILTIDLPTIQKRHGRGQWVCHWPKYPLPLNVAANIGLPLQAFDSPSPARPVLNRAVGRDAAGHIAVRPTGRYGIWIGIAASVRRHVEVADAGLMAVAHRLCRTPAR